MDEVHERSLDVDFILLLMKQSLLENRTQARLVVMSATLQANTFTSYFEDIQAQDRAWRQQGVPAPRVCRRGNGDGQVGASRQNVRMLHSKGVVPEHRRWVPLSQRSARRGDRFEVRWERNGSGGCVAEGVRSARPGMRALRCRHQIVAAHNNLLLLDGWHCLVRRCNAGHVARCTKYRCACTATNAKTAKTPVRVPCGGLPLGACFVLCCFWVNPDLRESQDSL